MNQKFALFLPEPHPTKQVFAKYDIPVATVARYTYLIMVFNEHHGVCSFSLDAEFVRVD
jgi:hypothetical protein